MALRRQRQLERKYSSFRKYTSTEDVNYRNRTSRSAYRSESVTSNTDRHGRSCSTEIITGSETRSFPVFVALQDYTPEENDLDCIPIEQGQIVEVLDSKNASKWLVRTKAKPQKVGWVPGSYFETPTQYYKQRKITRELAEPDPTLSPEEEALQKRDQAYGDLLKIEEEFVQSLGNLIDDYIKVFESTRIPEKVNEHKVELTSCLKELHNFHAHVLLKGLEYYSDNPGKVGHTFLRLEKDFDYHIIFEKDYQNIKKLIEIPEIREFLDIISNKTTAGVKTFQGYLEEIIGIIQQYENFFKEFIKYSQRANCSTKSMGKALEIIKSISKRSQDLTILEKIENYTGDVTRLGEILRQDIFQVWERETPIEDQNLFLFKNKIMMVTPIKDKNSFKHYATLRLDKYTVRGHTIDINSLVIQPNESGLPFFRVKPIDSKNQDIIVKAWEKDIYDMQEILATESGKSIGTSDDTIITNSSEYDATISDFKTDFTETSGSKRSSIWNGYNDPDEGPSSAKKTKSPPAISPTASSASICSGFSGTSSFGTEWSQTGSNLEFISASGKICKTQYGFRSFLSQGGAKLCLKVTGYPLPEITWYKDDVLMHETDRIKFYSDAEGHFALCFEGILESDTGRYTCIAQNEFGSASTSAQFRVIKAEKEAAPPVFVTKLKDQECVEGDIVCLEAEVDGWPEPDIVWLMDDSPIQQSSDFKILYDGKNASLEIRDAQPDDSGVYTLKIQNEYGTTQSDAILHVEADPDKNYVAPEFQSVIDDVEANEGDTVKFKAVMTGDPEPEIIWMVNGIPLTESEKIKMIQEDGICILTIKDVTRFFDGKVTCQAKNRLGVSDCNAILKIRIPPAAPNFEKHLESKLVQEKDTIVFECEVSGWEEPNVQFFLNGKELINNENRIQIIKKDTYYKIIITECSIDLHDGELVGRAVNQHGSAESRARITIEPPDESSKCAPTFLKDIEDQTVTEGEKAIFETTVKAHPPAKVSWLINGNIVDSNTPGIQIEVCNCDHKITIDSAQYAGTVLCRAENSIGRYETKARLIVIPKVVPKRPPEIIEHLKEVTEMETKTAIFEVRVTGNPQFEWYRNEERIYENDRIKIREFDGSSKLEIINLRLEEGGNIKVIAKNDVGEAISQSTLTIQQKPKAPEFIRIPEGGSGERGKEERFYALATGYPAPTYTWFINGRKVLPTTVEARVETAEDKTSILIIDTTHMEDLLKIEVLAENVAGIAKFELTMEVKRYEQRMESKSESNIQETKRAKVQEQHIQEETTSNVTKSNSTSTILEERYHEENITTTGLPTTGITVIPAILVPVAVIGLGSTSSLNNNIIEEVETYETTTTTTTESATTTTTKKEMKITRTLSDQNITRGEWANFGTVIENASNVVWLFNNSILTPGTGVKISSTETHEYNLSMDTTDRSTGDVTCRAETQTDEGTKVIEQTVKMVIDEKVEKPEISEGLKQVNVTEGESFTVDVVVNNKAQFIWTLNGTVMEDGSQGIHIKDNTNKSTFTVDEAKQVHNGEIKVTAQNEAGQTESKTDIIVEKKQTPARIEKGIESKEINESEQIEYCVKVSGFPEPNIKFYKNGNVIESGKDDIIIEKCESEYKLKLLNVKKGDSGKIEVIAENKCGSDKSSGDLKVIPKPVKPIIKTPLYDKNVDEGTPVRYDVELEEYDGSTTLDWYLNNKKLQPDGNFNIVDHQDGSFHINIRSPTESMTGTLKCVATNKAGECSSTGKLNIGKPKPPGSSPQFTKELQEKDVLEGESVKFSTIVSGDLPITIKWYLNNIEVVPIEEQIKVKYEESTGKTSIRIYKPIIDQTGEIKVKAENKYGEVIATTQLKVSKKLELPKFTSDMKSMQVVEGTPATFSCSVDGDPKPQCEWEFNGKPIVGDDKIVITQSEDTYKVTFLEPTLEMTGGEVAMIAKNGAGVKKQIATLSVRELGCAPTFSEELKNILVNENETVLMTAKLGKCKPEPTITFLKDGIPLSPDDEHIKTSKTDDGCLKLQILQAKTSDQSRITIKAENSFGVGETSASIGVEKIRAQKKPEFMSDIPPQTIREGDSLTTKVIISGNPDPFVKWYINNQLVCKTEDTELTSSQGVYSMTIHGCSTDMTGTIKCVAYNKMGENFKEGQLTVIAPIPVEFESCLCDATCREGDTLKLKAVLLGEPMPEVSWYINGKKLEETQNIKIHQDGSTYTVTIKDITLDFTGEVICKATNEFGSAESKAMLLVLPRGDPPDFLEWLSNIKARENSTVIHKVVFTGDPKPTLTWFINNEEIIGDDNITIVTNNDTSILTIKKFNPYKHCGEIICKAENEAGEVSCTATMAHYTSDMYSESESEAMADDAVTGDEGTDIQSDVEEEFRVPTPIMAPMFIKKMKDARANKGQQAIFECVVPNTKGIVCKWLKDGKEVELIARIRVVSQVVEEGKLEQLIIDDCLPEDTGEYTCVIQNEAGVDKCIAKLEVIDTHVKPQFVSQLQDQECKWKETATFECTVTGDLTSPCKWFKDEKLIENNDHFLITSDENGLQKLVINSTKLADSGCYKCLVEDKTGNIETSGKLKVKTIPPEFTKELCSQTLSLHEKLVLQCSVSGLPQPMVEFYANGERIQTGNGVSVQHDANNIHWRVVINSIEKELFTTFIAEAKSEVGTATSKCEIKEKIVDEPPEFGKKLQNIKVKEKEVVEMSVSVKGKPEPNVIFKKDGKDIEIDNDHILVRKEASGTYSLIINEARLEDIGTYSCVAINTAGEAETSCSFGVEKEIDEASLLAEPLFIEPLKSCQVTEKETVELVCKINEESKPTITWFKDNSPVKVGDHIIEEHLPDGSLKLKIINATLEDIGEYKCEAVNKKGKAITDSKLDVKHAEEQVISDDSNLPEPMFIQPLKPCQVNEEDTAELICKINEESKPEIHWYKDNTPVQTGEHITEQHLPDGSLKLTIQNAKIEDTGVYKCEAVNQKGKAVTDSSLDVKYADEKSTEDDSLLAEPLFIEPLKSCQVTEKETVELVCKINEESKPTIKWFKDNSPVKIGDHIIEEHLPDGSLKLKITNATIEDIGEYKCEAVNKKGKAITDSKLDVKHAEEQVISDDSNLPEPMFIEPLQPQSVAPGDTIELRCQINEDSKSTIQWLKDNKPIVITPNIKEEYLQDGVLKLTIQNASAEDVGVYQCIGINKKGKAITDSKLELKYASEQTIEDENNDEVVEEIEAFTIGEEERAKVVDNRGPPEFIELIRSCTIEPGKDAVLTCKVKGEPRPEINWSKDGKKITESEHIKIEYTKDNNIKLTIVNATLQDSGEYRCDATNELGAAWTEGPVLITTEMIIDGEAPDFLQPIKPVTVVEGQKAVLEGKLIGKPKPTVKWYKNGEVIKADNQRIIIEDLSDGTQRLTINETLMSDNDEYRCEATNEYGDVWADATLKVTPKDTLCSFKKGLENQELKKGSDLILEIEVDGKPKEVKFYKDNNEIDNVEDIGNGKYRVHVENVKDVDFGNYSVKVSNDAGIIESKAKIICKEIEKPSITQKLIPVTANEGDEVKFVIEVKGKVDAIEWKQNGKSLGPGKDLGNGKYELTIPSVKKDDAGDISVAVKNEGGTADDSTKLTVKGEPISIKKGLEDKQAQKGDKILLDIETSKKPKQVRFYKNGKEVPSKDLGDNKYGIEIPSVDKDDEASYTVKVTDDDDNEADSSCKLTVKLPAEKPSIVKGLVPTSANEGDEVKFVIEVKGKVDAIEWKQNGKSLGPGKDLGNGKYELTIPSVKKDDAGDISVVLKNEGGSADDSTKLTVKGEPISIKKGLEDKQAQKGDKILLDIETSKKPKQVRFYKNGKEVPSKDLGDNKYGIEIPSADKDDEASYTVKVTDDDGNEADSSCKLTVKLPVEKPSIVKGLVPTSANEGDEVKFVIEVKGKVDAIEWKQNGKSLGPGKDLGNGKYELTIPSVKKDDAGDISVAVKNEGGTADDLTKLTVKGEPISIKKGLEDKQAQKGDKILLDIETSKKPKQVRFYKNGKEIPSKDLGNNKYGIEIPSADKDDEASYTVKVTDDDGNEADSSCKLTVKLPSEPLKIIKGLEDLFIPEGKPIYLDVKTTGKPKQVRWYKNGKEDNENSKIVNENSFVYEIPSSTMNDSGVYEVEFANEEMTIKTKGNVTVEREPKFTKGLEDKTVKEGEEVIFEAETTEKVRIVKWYKNGKEIKESKRISFISIENSYKLLIKETEMDDFGEYKIVLQNSAGKIESEAKLTVLSASDVEPKIVKGLISATIDAGDEHSFRVEVSAPVKKVIWFRNGKEVKSCSGIELKTLNPKKYELLIKSAMAEDIGNYKVVLSNDAGECDSSGDLDVKVPEIVKLIDGLKDQDINEDEPLQLKVKISGKPRQVKWYKNGQEIIPNENLKLSDSNGEYTLTIPTSKADDAGVYRVVFTHDKGELQSSCSVYVKPKKKDFVGTSPEFLGPLSDVTIPEGETLVLKCQVFGNPMPDLKWFKDGIEIQKSDRVTLRLSLDGTASLRILDSTKDDSGKYSIVAKNDFGEKESSCKASVLDESEIPGPPRFIIPLKTTDGKVGEKVEFSVKVRGFPKPEIKFILNNNEINNNDNYLIEDLGDGHWMFTIKSINPDDFGSIRAIAENEFGQVECNASFCESLSRTFKPRDEEGYEPRWNVPLWDRRLPMGHPASIECHVDAKPKAEITWLFEEKIITSDMKGIEFVNTPDGCCKLKVLHLTPEWVGMYKCIAKNSYGVADTRANLNIEEEYIEQIEHKREYPPRFNPQLEDAILEIGKTITLSTVVDAIPMASISWYKDGLPIKLTSNMSTDFDEENGRCTLTLKDVTEADTGAYRCIATNIHGTTNTACLVGIKTPKIEIIKEGEEPFFTKGLTDKWVDRGGELFMTCTVTGSPFPQIKFYRNGVLLRSNNKVKIEILPDGVCNLTVSDCTLSDEGIYRCEAENKYGKAKTQSTIHVEVNLRNIDRSIKEDGEAPRFIIPLEDNTVLLDNTIELSCKVTGKPMPVVKWSKDGAPLFEDKRFEWNNNPSNGTYSLRINNCKNSDEGTYRCIATNDEGSANTKAFISIDDGGYSRRTPTTSEKVQPPRIILNIGDARANEGSPLKLICKIEASPLPEIVWYKNGEKVIPNDDYQISLEPDGTATLYIPKCTIDDDGIYRVIATNIHGTVQSKGNATVKRIPGSSNGLPVSPYRSPSSSYDTGKAPKVIIPLDNIKITDRQSFKLRCKFSGERMQIRWFKDGERLYSFGRTQVFENIDGNTELEVLSASRFDAGCYRCVAENEYGSARTTCDVIIEAKGRKISRDYTSDLSSGNAPGFITPLTIKRVKVGEDVTFECLPYGKPFPDIKWLKDGLELSNSQNVIIESETEGKQRLTIKSAKFESEGYYRCVATNSFGTASTKAELIVTGMFNNWFFFY
ncbi:Hemicentin-1 [Strongyloides ratti]|uniref:Hemicentin-1 n=1 Tax=Strongyloides ratti TaxID=34506 RepID=A0A090L846_STRRB|nr:Hemicentin-1 [Strongyloides ratti]CEF63660.1 Hemicentin-1 [Strongyloides ratti]